jgi:AAA family ATP:ADP antiporter
MMISFYEMIVTIFDYYFKRAAASVYPNDLDYADYLNNYAIATGLVSATCVILGINKIQRIFGMKISLFMTPILVGLAAIALKLNPDSLRLAFCVIVLSKAVNYALNQPTIKQLYIPTTKDTKYKAQAWLEMFGSRGAKGSAGFVTGQYGALKARLGAAAGGAHFLWLMAGVAFGCVAIWIPVAAYVAKTYDKAIKEKKTVC